MRTVWKEPVFLSATPQVLRVPKGSKIVAVAEQNSLVAVWFEVEVGENGYVEQTEERVFVIVGTGEPIPDGFTEHRGTSFHGAFVFHLYEKP